LGNDTLQNIFSITHLSPCYDFLFLNFYIVCI
jgi:hypothetical protein